MTEYKSLSSYAIADAGTDGNGGTQPFDVRATVINQYANSPVLLALVDRMAAAIDPSDALDQFYTYVWDVRTANTYGLDVLGRIVGVNRVLRVPTSVPYLGFAQADTPGSPTPTDVQPFGFGIWAGGGTLTQNYPLTNDAFRRLVLAKAALNICNGSIRAVNAALMSLFPDRGNCYCQDNGGMAMTYVFGQQLTDVEYAIVTQSGVLPKPVGVSVSGEVSS